MLSIITITIILIIIIIIVIIILWLRNQVLPKTREMENVIQN